METVSETYLKDRNSGCYLYIIAELLHLTCYTFILTHSAREYSEKLAFLKKQKTQL